MTSGKIHPSQLHPIEKSEGAPSPPRRVISSQELLHGEQEVLIDHEGEQYRLRLTRNGKLILQK